MQNQRERRKSNLELKFIDLKEQINKFYGYNRKNLNFYDKKNDVELAHRIREIESYGFNFFPYFYVRTSVYKLERYFNSI